MSIIANIVDLCSKLLDALFAALVVKYQELGGKPIKLDAEELESLKMLSGDYTSLNIERELIIRHLKNGSDFMAVSQIHTLLSEQSKIALSANNLSREMTKQGYKKERKRVNGSQSALSGFYVSFLGYGSNVDSTPMF